jgi:hypothetical protein
MQNINIIKSFLGTFKVDAGKLFISDPCYSKDVWCVGNIEDVVNGTWNAFAMIGETSHGWGKRVWELIALKDGNFVPQFKELTEIHVGVDAGMAGIYNETSFKGGNSDDAESVVWYDECLQICLDQQAGIIEGGCIASSGFGDGLYNCFIDRDEKKQVVGVKIVFISKKDELGIE